MDAIISPVSEPNNPRKKYSAKMIFHNFLLEAPKVRSSTFSLIR